MKLEPGGSPGGEVKFLIGLVLSVVGIWLFLDSVHIATGHRGFFSGMAGRHGGMGETTSAGILIVPLFAGVVALFFNAKQKWAWGLTWLGLAILIIEIVSRFRPVVQMKVTHALIVLVMIAGGVALMLRAYTEHRNEK